MPNELDGMEGFTHAITSFMRNPALSKLRKHELKLFVVEKARQRPPGVSTRNACSKHELTTIS